MVSPPQTVLHLMLARGYGGIEEAYLRYSVLLQQMGMRVVAVIHPKAAVRARLPAGIDIYTLPHLAQWDIAAVLRLRRLIRRHRPDLILAHGNRAARFGYWASRGICPELVVLHRPRFKGLHRYDHIIAVTKHLRDEALAHGVRPEHISTIPNFLTETPLPRAPRPPAPVPVIGFLGRFVPEKGMDLLVDAAAILKKRGLRFVVHLGGDGLLRPRIEARIRALELGEEVRLSGWVAERDTWYKSLDIVVVPSRSESFGLVILEAWRHHLPVIATRTAGPAELMTDGVNGLLAQADALSLAEGLAQLITDARLRDRLACATEAALAPYLAANIAPRLRQIIRDALGTQ
jgi:glycosyltransferase involved in cell wall biosynthesis